MRARTIEGFDYRLQKRVARLTTEWRDEMRALLGKGNHRRRFEADNEGPVTYLHGKDGQIVFEVYGKVPV